MKNLFMRSSEVFLRPSERRRRGGHATTCGLLQSAGQAITHALHRVNCLIRVSEAANAGERQLGGQLRLQRTSAVALNAGHLNEACHRVTHEA